MDKSIASTVVGTVLGGAGLVIAGPAGAAAGAAAGVAAGQWLGSDTNSNSSAAGETQTDD